MKRGRKTVYEERMEIVQYAEKNDYNYTETAKKYGVSYQQVYTWVAKHKAHGPEGLKDRRGQSLASKENLTDAEHLKLKNQELEKKNQYLEIENEALKKLKEIEGRGVPEKEDS